MPYLAEHYFISAQIKAPDYASQHCSGAKDDIYWWGYRLALRLIFRVKT